jgi:hypothetical protein
MDDSLGPSPIGPGNRRKVCRRPLWLGMLVTQQLTAEMESEGDEWKPPARAAEEHLKYTQDPQPSLGCDIRSFPRSLASVSSMPLWPRNSGNLSRTMRLNPIRPHTLKIFYYTHFRILK